MARSSGYRAKKANREEVAKLRAELAKCTSTQWIRAQSIMQDIIIAIGKKGGPSGMQVLPRCCKLCDHYGHTAEKCTRCPNGLPYAEEKRIVAARERAEWFARDPAGYYDHCMVPYRLVDGEPVKLEFGETVLSGGSIHPDGVWEFGWPGESTEPAAEFHRRRIQSEECAPCS